MKTQLTHYSFALVCLFLISITACNQDKKATTDATEETTTTTTPEEPSNPSPADTTVVDSTDTETSEETTDIDDGPSNPTPVSGGGGLPARNLDEERLSVVLDLIAQDLESQNLAYKSELGQDCSGIYHKIKDQIQRKFKDLGDLDKYQYPSFESVRSSRQIAHWYHENGNLRIIQNAKVDANKIRPGTVMFYGRSSESYSNLNIEMLTNPGKFYHDAATGLGKIMHIAVVTKVLKDEAGNVSRYTIMHGRNSKHNASRTGSNYDGPGFETQHAKFPFGNWNQQLVAMAYIETPK